MAACSPRPRSAPVQSSASDQLASCFAPGVRGRRLVAQDPQRRTAGSGARGPDKGLTAPELHHWGSGRTHCTATLHCRRVRCRAALGGPRKRWEGVEAWMVPQVRCLPRRYQPARYLQDSIPVPAAPVSEPDGLAGEAKVPEWRFLALSLFFLSFFAHTHTRPLGRRCSDSPRCSRSAVWSARCPLAAHSLPTRCPPPILRAPSLFPLPFDAAPSLCFSSPSCIASPSL